MAISVLFIMCLLIHDFFPLVSFFSAYFYKFFTIIFLFFKFIFIFAVLGSCCTGFSLVAAVGLFFIAVQASLIVEHRL